MRDADPAAPCVALFAAFPSSVPQGSQVFAAEQARALAAAGARVSFLCCGPEGPERPGALGAPGEPGASAVDLRHASGPLARAPLRAGPSLRRLPADAALLAAWLQLARERRFDAVLAHNAEAALVAIAARPATGVPVIYVAHTLLRHELSAYAPRALGPAADGVGQALDALLAGAADAAIALAPVAAAALRRHARGAVFLLPPGLDPRPAPDDARIAAACAAHGLPREGYVLYAGNLDRYQELGRFAGAAALLSGIPCVVATHDRERSAPQPLRTLRVATVAEARALTFGCAIAVLTRRRPGGFPMKLLNYMEAARPIVAYRDVAGALEPGRSGHLLDAGAGPQALARAIADLLADRAAARALGLRARARLEEAHAWPGIAAETLSLVRALRRRG